MAQPDALGFLTRVLVQLTGGPPGRDVYFLIERHRLEGLRSLLPADVKASLEVVDDTNNKVYLARAPL